MREGAAPRQLALDPYMFRTTPLTELPGPGGDIPVHQHLDIGQGEADWDEFFGTLGRLRFDGIATGCVFAWEDRARESGLSVRERIETYTKDRPARG
jgi:sugar phosphate isomerase/epimerase